MKSSSRDGRSHSNLDRSNLLTDHSGGGRGTADANGHRAQAKDQQSSPIGLGFERARVNKLAIVVIAGMLLKIWRLLGTH